MYNKKNKCYLSILTVLCLGINTYMVELFFF